MPSQNPLPLVSIIIATYNNESTIRKALESALKQTYPQLEIVVNDDCSKDSTEAIIEDYLYDTRIKYSKNTKNLGVYANFDKCIRKLASGIYFTMVNGDDEFINDDFVKSAVEIMNSNPGLNFVKGGSLHSNRGIGKYHTYDAWPSMVSSGEFFKSFDKNMDFGFVGIFFNRQIFNSFDFFNRFEFYGMDYFINFIMASNGGVGFVKTPSYQFNVHDSNSNYKVYEVSQIEVFFKEFREVVYSDIAKNISDLSILGQLFDNYSSKFIQSVVEHYYRFRRGKIHSVIELLKKLAPTQTSAYINGKRWRWYRVIFFNDQIGDWLMKKSWQLKAVKNKF